jgi:hypothetical protein
MLQAPEPFVLVTEFDASEVVDIGSFRMQELPQQPFPDHIQDHQLSLSVAAVLHHHAVTAGLLCCLHEAPAVIRRIGSWNLDGGVLAGFHGFEADGYVPSPGGGVEDQVYVVSLAESTIVGFASRIEVRCRLASFDYPLSNLSSSGLVDITESLDLDPLDLQEVPNVPTALKADTHESHSDLLQRRSGETDRSTVFVSPFLAPGCGS